MAELRPSWERTCPVCGEAFVTTNPRKVYTNKQCADRSRNLPAVPVGMDGRVELKHMAKFPQEVRREVLLGGLEHRIVMWDLECTHLKPNVGRILCCSFKPLGGEVYTFSAHDKRFKEKDVFDDGKLATAIRDELEKYDIIVGWNSKMFDLKFLNARLLRAGERTKQAGFHIDGMWGLRSKANCWAKLASVQQMLGTETEKTSISWDGWMRALGWDKKLRELAMAEIVDHCERDVMALEEVYVRLVEADVIRGLRRDGGIL